MSTKHTPGPWIIRRSTSGYPYQITAPNGSHVKDVTRWASISVPSLPEGEANANLIAAAPELLALVEEYRSVAAYYAERDEKAGDTEGAALKRFTVRVIDVVLSKARGEP